MRQAVGLSLDARRAQHRRPNGVTAVDPPPPVVGRRASRRDAPVRARSRGAATESYRAGGRHVSRSMGERPHHTPPRRRGRGGARSRRAPAGRNNLQAGQAVVIVEEVGGEGRKSDAVASSRGGQVPGRSRAAAAPAGSPLADRGDPACRRSGRAARARRGESSAGRSKMDAIAK